MLNIVYCLTLFDNFLGRIQERLEEIQEIAAPRRVGLYLAQLALAAQDAPRPGPVAIARVPRPRRAPVAPRVPHRDLIPADRVPRLMRGIDLDNIIPGMDRLRPRH